MKFAACLPIDQVVSITTFFSGVMKGNVYRVNGSLLWFATLEEVPFGSHERETLPLLFPMVCYTPERKKLVRAQKGTIIFYVVQASYMNRTAESLLVYI